MWTSSLLLISEPTRSACKRVALPSCGCCILKKCREENFVKQHFLLFLAASFLGEFLPSPEKVSQSVVKRLSYFDCSVGPNPTVSRPLRRGPVATPHVDRCRELVTEEQGPWQPLLTPTLSHSPEKVWYLTPLITVFSRSCYEIGTQRLPAFERELAQCSTLAQPNPNRFGHLSIWDAMKGAQIWCEVRKCRQRCRTVVRKVAVILVVGPLDVKSETNKTGLKSGPQNTILSVKNYQRGGGGQKCPKVLFSRSFTLPFREDKMAALDIL